MKLLILVIVFGLAGAAPVEDNKECQPHSRPWHVRLHGGGASCSGALIDKWWIVTFFNCAPTPYATIASLGEHDITVEEGTEQHIYVSDVIYHSPYRSPEHSLVMVRLSEPANFNEYVQPISLPSRCPQPGETCSASSWDVTFSNQNEPIYFLKCVSVSVVNDTTCMNRFPEDFFWSSHVVCAGQPNNLDDREAIVMVCDHELQGLQWFMQPTIYTKMCLYNKWIKHVMDDYVPLLPTETTPMTIT